MSRLVNLIGNIFGKQYPPNPSPDDLKEIARDAYPLVQEKKEQRKRDRARLKEEEKRGAPAGRGVSFLSDEDKGLKERIARLKTLRLGG